MPRAKVSHSAFAGRRQNLDDRALLGDEASCMRHVACNMQHAMHNDPMKFPQREMPRTDDPRPAPPERPLPEDCCQSGCHPCVFDLYEEALERYEERLREWNARHGEASG
ncbi:oxidoreductase-like domain-containing protein [Caballeronia sp. LZ003]|uniref:oxidoreductase-like domain-containing protein n=1 Tax=unclassified Caballeronia TaxID=2646786 RepID=UPI003857B7FB